MAEVFGLRLSGVMAWILRRAVYLANFPTLGRKVRVLVEWIWTCLFEPDIAHLSFSRTTRVRLAEAVQRTRSEAPRPQDQETDR